MGIECLRVKDSSSISAFVFRNEIQRFCSRSSNCKSYSRCQRLIIEFKWFLATATKSSTCWPHISIDTEWWSVLWTSMANWNRSFTWRTCQTYWYCSKTTWTFLQTEFVFVMFILNDHRIGSSLSASPNHMPFVRSFDENNGRVVFNYAPETCGYVSHSQSFVSFDRRWRFCFSFGLVSSISNWWKSWRLSTSIGNCTKSRWYNSTFRITFWKWQFNESGSSVR